PEMDIFACGYCGSRQVVQRQGGTVSLKLIGEAIARVQDGTDRTAAELAVRRLREELVQVEAKVKTLGNQSKAEEANSTTGVLLIVLVLFVTVFAVSAARDLSIGAKVITLMVAAPAFFMWNRVRYRFDHQRRLRAATALERAEVHRDGIVAEINEHLA